METTTTITRRKLALWFSVQNDVRFLSHHDTMRLWQRALTRARIPVRYSCGFNPHMRISLPLPRSVGMATKKDLLLIELDEQPLAPDALDMLKNQLPEGIDIIHTSIVPAEASFVPAWATYQIFLDEKVDKPGLKDQIDTFMKSDDWIVVRAAHGRHPRRNIHLRSCISELELKQNALSYKFHIQPKGTARVNELTELLGINQPGHITGLERIETEYSPNGVGNN